MLKDVLHSLRLGGYAPRTMLDIGAHIGTFTQEFLGVFPGCVPTLVEPNPFCLSDLSRLGFEQHGVAASDAPGHAELFLSREWLQSTGTSLYRENTAFFRDEVVVKKQVEKARLDDLFAGRRFDFVKIDTQGSELDVILGGPTVLAQADYILVEVSLVEYNIGGARAEALFAKLSELGFHCTEVADFHRLASVHDGNLLQMDFLFARRRGIAQGRLADMRNLAKSLYGDGRLKEALLLLDHLGTLQSGDLETLRLRVKVLAALGETLEVLHVLAALKARAGNVEELLGEIRGQMPTTLARFNALLAAGEIESAEKHVAALAALLPGNAAILDCAMTCNQALGREPQAQTYAAALRALGATQTTVPIPQDNVRALPKKRNRSRGRS
jgi:FkbM family methyltransferase